MPPIPTADGKCPCGHPYCTLGTHQLNCKKWAGRSWAKGHDLVVKAVAYEARRLGLGAVDKDAQMKHDHSHLNSAKRGDLALTTNGQLEITNVVERRPRSDLILDIKIVAVVSSEGDWHARLSPTRTRLLNSVLQKAEQVKFNKHEANYAAISRSFLPFVVSCFGALGHTAIRFLDALAFLETRQNDDLRAQAGLDPLDPKDRSQFRARCYRQSCTRIAAAQVKATVMRLTGEPSLPAPSYLPHCELARNCPGPALHLPRGPTRRCPPTLPSLHSSTPSSPTSTSPPPSPLLSAAPCPLSALPPANLSVSPQSRLPLMDAD